MKNCNVDILHNDRLQSRHNAIIIVDESMTEIYGAESFAISDSLSSGIRRLYPFVFSVESGVHMQATTDSIIALALCGCIAACIGRAAET